MTRREGALATAFLTLLAIEFAAAAGLALIGSLRSTRINQVRPVNLLLVSEFGLADLALWSDASYCRHPSSGVFFTAHSDHPSAMEHFPAGSMVPPPMVERQIRTAAP